MKKFILVKNLMIISIILVLPLLVIVNLSFGQDEPIKAEPVKGIKDLADRIDRNYETLSELPEIRDGISENDGSLDQIKQMLQAIGAKYEEMEGMLVQIKKKIEDVERRIIPAGLAIHWISPYFFSYHSYYHNYDDDYVFSSDYQTVISILNPGASPVDVAIEYHNSDGSLDSVTTLQLNGGERKHITTYGRWGDSVAIRGWVEIKANKPVLPHGHVRYEDLEGDFGTAEAHSFGVFQMTWYPMVAQ